MASAVITALTLLAAGSGRVGPVELCIGGCFTHGPPLPLSGDEKTGKAKAIAARQQSLVEYPFNQASYSRPEIKKRQTASSKRLLGTGG